MTGGRSVRWICLPLLCVLLGACASAGGRTGAEGASGQRQEAARVHTQLGTEYMRRGQYQVALEKLERALSFDANYSPAYTVLGVLYERLGEFQTAGEHYRKGANLDPDNGGAQNNYGRWLCGQGETDDGLRYLQRALDNPFYETPEVAHANAGICALDAGQSELAESHLRKALELQPNFPDALYAMAELRYNSEDFFRARAFLQRFESAAQASPASLLLGYRIESSLGDLRAAREYQDQLVARFPDAPQVHQLDRYKEP